MISGDMRYGFQEVGTSISGDGNMDKKSKGKAISMVR